MENGGECFLVLDERLKVAHRHLKMIKELRALLEDEGLVAGRYAVGGRAKRLVVLLNEEVGGREERLATLKVFSCAHV